MSEGFTDYYELMQISPNAETSTVVRVFRMLAARYHPDNAETGDMSLFLRLTEAYKTLSNPESRAQYDARWQSETSRPMGIFGRREFGRGLEGETNRRLGLLTLLYSRRRANPDRPGCSVLELEQSMATPREHLMFSLWYLKDKEFLAQNETSDYVITHLGVDYVESKLPEHETLHRLIEAAEAGRARSEDASPWPIDPWVDGDDSDGETGEGS